MNINSVAESLLSGVFITSGNKRVINSHKCKQVGRTIRKNISQSHINDKSQTEATLFNGLFTYLANKEPRNYCDIFDVLTYILGSYYFAINLPTLGDKTIAHLSGTQLIVNNELHQVFFADVEIIAINKNNMFDSPREVEEFLIWDNVLGFAGIAVDRKYIGQNRFCAGQLYCADVKKFKSKEEALRVYVENNNTLI